HGGRPAREGVRPAAPRGPAMRRAGARAALAGVTTLVLLALGGAVAPWLAPAGPYAADLTGRLGPPSDAHLFGQATLGRDVLARAAVMTLRRREFVEAALALGATPVRIVCRHLLPLAAPMLLVQATFGMAGAIVAEGSLSFLGVGAPPPLPSWGAMIDEGRPFL